MPSKSNVWSRIAYLIDAFSLIKLTGAAVVFVLFEGSPLFALGVVFAAPVIAVCGTLIVRLLRQAATGRGLDYSERPRPRSFVSNYEDVTPIKYRQVRTSLSARP